MECVLSRSVQLINLLVALTSADPQTVLASTNIETLFLLLRAFSYVSVVPWLISRYYPRFYLLCCPQFINSTLRFQLASFPRMEEQRRRLEAEKDRAVEEGEQLRREMSRLREKTCAECCICLATKVRSRPTNKEKEITKEGKSGICWLMGDKGKSDTASIVRLC